MNNDIFTKPIDEMNQVASGDPTRMQGFFTVSRALYKPGMDF